MATGTVKWFRAQDGYTLITPDDGGEDVDGHYSGIDAERVELSEGKRVSYDMMQGPKFMVAVDIEAIE